MEPDDGVGACGVLLRVSVGHHLSDVTPPTFEARLASRGVRAAGREQVTDPGAGVHRGKERSCGCSRTNGEHQEEGCCAEHSADAERLLQRPEKIQWKLGVGG